MNPEEQVRMVYELHIAIGQEAPVCSVNAEMDLDDFALSLHPVCPAAGEVRLFGPLWG